MRFRRLTEGVLKWEINIGQNIVFRRVIISEQKGDSSFPKVTCLCFEWLRGYVRFLFFYYPQPMFNFFGKPSIRTHFGLYERAGMASIWSRFDQTENVMKPREGIFSLSAKTSKCFFADWAKSIERNLNSRWSSLLLRSRCPRLLLPWPVFERGPLSIRYGRSHCIYHSKRLLSVGRFLLYGVEYYDKALLDSHNTVEHQSGIEFHHLACTIPMSSQEWLPESPKLRETQLPQDHAQLVWQRHFKPPSKFSHSILDRVGSVNGSIGTAWDAPANGISLSPHSYLAPRHLPRRSYYILLLRNTLI